MAIAGAGAAGVFHRHVVARVGEAGPEQGREDGEGAGAHEIGIGGLIADQQVGQSPERADSQDVPHLMEDDHLQLAACLEAREVGHVEPHSAHDGQAIVVADPARTRGSKDAPGTVDRLQPDKDHDVIHVLVYRGTERARWRDRSSFVGQVPYDRQLPAVHGRVERGALSRDGSRPTYRTSMA